MRYYGLLWILAVLLLPFAAAGIYRTADEHKAIGDGTHLMVAVQTENGRQEMGATEFLTGVVAGQIEADYEPETLKAQAIIARTVLYERAGKRSYIEAEETGLIWRSETFLKKMWGLRCVSLKEKVKAAVMATDGLVLRYAGKMIVPAYFAVSSGNTRSSLEAWGMEIPWLQSVQSPWDQEAEGYETIIYKTKYQMIEEIKACIPDFECAVQSLAATYQITQIDSAGYVSQMQIGNKLLSGEELRYALHLPSACFEITFDGTRAVIIVYGIGHGVGFDQYGANRQAKEGKNCVELLQYYFSGVEVGE